MSVLQLRFQPCPSVTHQLRASAPKSFENGLRSETVHCKTPITGPKIVVIQLCPAIPAGSTLSNQRLKRNPEWNTLIRPREQSHNPPSNHVDARQCTACLKIELRPTQIAQRFLKVILVGGDREEGKSIYTESEQLTSAKQQSQEAAEKCISRRRRLICGAGEPSLFYLPVFLSET